jgi:hypothetical protein
MSAQFLSLVDSYASFIRSFSEFIYINFIIIKYVERKGPSKRPERTKSSNEANLQRPFGELLQKS